MKCALRLACYYALVKPFLCLVLGVLVKGRENIQGTGQCIIVSNHNSHLDTIAILHVVGGRRMRKMRPVAAEDYFCRSRFLHSVVSALFNILPICRGPVRGRACPVKVLDRALEEGDSLILYPEGTRGEPERLAEFRSGVGHVVARHPGVDVIPLYLKGLGKVMPRGAWYPVPHEVYINVGKPCVYKGTPKKITAQIREDIEELKRQVEASTLISEESRELLSNPIRPATSRAQGRGRARAAQHR